MKHKLNLILAIGMLAGFITPSPKLAQGSLSSPTVAVAAERSGQPALQATGDMPGWSIFN